MLSTLGVDSRAFFRDAAILCLLLPTPLLLFLTSALQLPAMFLSVARELHGLSAMLLLAGIVVQSPLIALRKRDRFAMQEFVCCSREARELLRS